MPTDRTGKEGASSSSKRTRKTSLKGAPSINPGTAPLLPGAKLKSQKAFKTRKAAREAKKHTTKHVKVIHKHAAKVAVHVSHGYKKTDTKLVTATKRMLPERTLHQLAANKSANNGNLRFSVPLPAKPGKKVPIVVPKGLRHIRHAALPGTLVAVLVFAFGFVGASPPGYGGTKVLGGSGSDRALQTAVDSGDNVYTLGTFNGTVNFASDWSGSDSKTSTEANGDIFLTKTNTNGSYGWTKRIAGSVAGSQYTYRAATDGSGAVYVAGAFDGTVDFAVDFGGTDEKTSTGQSDAFVTKINGDGSYGWTKQFGGTFSDNITGLGITGNKVILSGIFNDTVVFDADFGSSADSKTSNGLSDIFIATINSDGTYGSTKQIGGTLADTATVSIVSGSGDIYVAGTFDDTVNFAAAWSGFDDKVCAADVADAFVTKINANDTYGWTKCTSDTGAEIASALTVDGLGNIYVGGKLTSSSANFAADFSGTDTRSKQGTQDAFVTKINANDTYGWTNTFGGNSVATDLNGLATDSQNNIYLTGVFNGGSVNFAADFSGSDSKTTTGAKSFATKIKSDNSYDWTVVPGLGADATATANDIAVDSGDNVFTVGSFGKSVNFAADFAATDERTSTGDDAAYSDAFVTKISTVETVYKVGDASGLTFKDSGGTNLSSTGTADTNPTVYIHDQNDDTLLATIAVDLSEDRDWSNVSGDSDTGMYKMFVANAIGAPGADTSMTLYVPKQSGDNAVVLCPGAEDVASVTKTCANKRTLTAHDAGVTSTEISGTNYWAITNVTDQKIGGMSTSFPGVSITETDDSTAVVEGGAGDHVSLRLNAQPTSDVTVTIITDPDNQLEAIEPIIFTTSNWDTPVNVYVAATDDHSIEGNHSVSLGYTAASEDEYYDGTSESDIVTVSITDNDEAGVVLHNTDNVITEGGDTTEVCATLTAQPSHDVILQLAASDTSEVTIPGSITITRANWDTQAANCFTISPVDDDEVDGPKNSNISVSGITSDDTHFAGLDVGTISAVTITVQDNDSAAFIVSTSDTTTTEAGGSVDVCIKLTARPTSNVTVPTASSDTTEGSVGASSIVIAPASWNSNSNCVTVTGVDDAVVDGDMAYSITTGDPTSADPTWDALDANAVADQGLVNEDDDTANIVVIQTSGTTAVTEGGSTDSFTIGITSQPAAGKQVVVQVQPNAEIDLGAGAGQAIAKTFTEENWDQPQTVTVTAVNDSKVEGNHSGLIDIVIDPSTSETPYSGLSPQSITVAITDNDIATASIATIDDATENPSSNGKFRVSLDHQNNTGSDMTFNYSVSGTAVSGTHYTALLGSATIADGADSVDIILDVSGHNNSLLEGNKTVVITLADSLNPHAQISESNASATATVFDDERGVISLAAIQNGNEAGPVDIVYTATMNTQNDTGSDITVAIDPIGGTATSGTDYESFSGEHIAIPSGASTGSITVPVIDDNLFEPTTETVGAEITQPSINIVSIMAEEDYAEAIITDNDTAVVNLTATQAMANENPSSNGTVTFALDKVNSTGSNIQISYTVSGTATAGSDYNALSGSATIPGGQQSTTVTIDTSGHDDDDMEGNETVILTYNTNSLSDRVSVGDSTVTVTIVDDETAGVTATATDDTTSEDGDTGRICFTLASRPSSPVTVGLTSSDANKVSVPNSITIERDNWNNANANCVTVTGHDDDPPASTGTENTMIQTTGVTSDDPFYSQLTGADIADITIHHEDNDSPGVIVTTVSSVTSEDGTKSAHIRFSLRTQPVAAVTIPLSISDATEGSIAVTQIVIDPEDWNNPSVNEVVVSGVDDYLTDGTITYQLVTGDPSSDDTVYNALGASDVSDISLTNEDDDVAGVTITETSGSTAVSEAGATDTFSIELTSQPAPGNQVVVKLDPNGELGLGSGAGQVVTRTFTEGNWNTPQQITVSANDDAKVEGDHSGTVVVNIDDATTEDAYDGLDQQTINVAITDNDIATATIVKTADASENPSQNGTFRVTLDKPNNTGSGMAFTYSVGGSAESGVHYTALSGTVIISNGNSSADITVDVSGHDNTKLEGNKTVVATLTGTSNPSGAVSEADKSASLTIADDERATVSLSATQNGNEAGPADIIYTATLSKQNDTGSDITVDIDPSGGNATKGSDYADFSGQQIIIPSGASSGTIHVTVIDDAIFEAVTETVQATISNPSHSFVTIDEENDIAQATITDNETAQLSLQASQPNAAENPSSNGQVTFQLDKTNNTGNNIDIDYTVSGTATADSDYNALSGHVSIPNGQQSAAVTVDTSGHDDDDMEGPETVILTYADNNTSSRVGVGTDTATVTITDDETTGVTLHVTDDTTSESGATGKICFTLKSRPSAAVTILLASSDASKVSVPSSVTIARNDWNNDTASCVIATGHDDNPPEVTGTQDVTIQTTGVTTTDLFYSQLTGGDIADAVMHHADNDTPGITVHTISARTKEDGSKTAVVRFELTTQPTDTVTIPLAVSDATEGSVASSIIITPENWNVPAANEAIVQGVDDRLIDGDIGYTLQTGDPSSADTAYNALGANDVDNVSLVNEDDDVAGVTVMESGGSTQVAEGGATDTHSVSIATQPATGKVVVITATPADTQVDLGSGAGVPITLVFDDSNWQGTQTITVAALDDTLLEGDHTSLVTYAIKSTDTTETAYKTYNGLPTVTVHITDNDTATADLTVQNGNEAGPVPITATVTLSKANNTASPITFILNPNGGTATAGADYADFANTTVTIPVGETTADVQIGVIDDALLEGNETVDMILSSPSIPIVTIANTSRSATIADNDTATATVVATTPTATENPATDGEFTVYLSKTNNTGAPITVQYTVGGTATAGADYEALSGSVSIAHGASSATIPVHTSGYNDSTVENSETVIVTLQSTNHGQVSVGNPASATVTIADDDGFTTTITKVADGAEAGPTSARFRVQLSQVNTTGSPFTVQISDTHNGSAVSGNDYQAFGGIVTIPNGQQYADYDVQVIDDNDLENVTETVEAELSNPSEGELGVSKATATITDNDTANLTVTATQATAHENPATNGEFTITLDKENKGTNPILITYTVNGTAVAPDDYAILSGSAMIAPGTIDTVVTVDTAGRDDGIHEGDETVILALSNVDHQNVSIGNPSSATVTIIDDDPEPQNPPVNNGGDGNSSNPSSSKTAPVQLVSRTVIRIPVSAEAAQQNAQPEAKPTTPKPQPVDQKPKDLDSDGISDDEESKANNNGDGNGDGIPDSQQDNVASVVSSITDKPVTLEARGDCSVVEHFAVVSEDRLSKQDGRYRYPFGLVDYKLGCEKPGQSGIVTVYFDQIYANPGRWRKFMAGQENFAAMDFVKNAKQPVGRNKVTTINYIIRDGGEQDDDDKQNGKIADPAGFATRTFYILDAGWAIPVLLAGWFMGYAVWHRAKDHRRYR